jgi:phage I-like protein
MTIPQMKEQLNQLLEQHADQIENTWMALAGELPTDMQDAPAWFATAMNKRRQIDELLQRAAAEFGKPLPTSFPNHHPN